MNKCRLCFETLQRRPKPILIDENIEGKFFAVTQIELRSSINYSDLICFSCDEELDKFMKFKSNLVDKQLQLYELYPDDEELFDIEVCDEEFAKPEHDILQINVKEEPGDVINTVNVGKQKVLPKRAVVKPKDVAKKPKPIVTAKKRSYTVGEKLKIIDESRESNLTGRKFAESKGICESVLRRWVAKERIMRDVPVKRLIKLRRVPRKKAGYHSEVEAHVKMCVL
jgi:hypothetical protein